MRVFKILLLGVIVTLSCSKNMKLEDDAVSSLKILKNITEELSFSLNHGKSRMFMFNDFKLTDMKNDRKMPLKKAVNIGLVSRDAYDRLRALMPEDSFVMIMWERWFKAWKEGKIEPYITYDPLKDEEEIKKIPLYRNGVIEKWIDSRDFDKYPVIVISPEWWEGDESAEYLTGDKGPFKNRGDFKTFSRPYISQIKIYGWYDGRKSWTNPGWRMEIYTITYPLVADSLNHIQEDHRDFDGVDEGYKTYNVHGNIHSGYNGYARFRVKVMEQDGGLRFNDDYVGTITISGSYWHGVRGHNVWVKCIDFFSH